MRAVNLIPADDATAGGSRSPAGSYALIGVLALLVALSASYTLVTRSISSKRAELASVTAQADRTEAQAATLKSYADFSKLRDQRLETVKNLVDSRFDWAHAFRSVAGTLPSGAWVTSLRATVSPGVQVDGNADALRGAIPAPAIEMAGCATTQAGVARTMSALRGMGGVQRVTLSQSQKTGQASSDSGGDSAGHSAGCGAGAQFSLTIFFEATKASSPTTAAATGGTTTP
jgi:Tfp pilus assembly protein PilN